MIKYLIHRPISVLMVFSALFILGIILYMNIPVTLLPNIAIPEITVQVQDIINAGDSVIYDGNMNLMDQVPVIRKR